MVLIWKYDEYTSELCWENSVSSYKPISATACSYDQLYRDWCRGCAKKDSNGNRNNNTCSINKWAERKEAAAVAMDGRRPRFVCIIVESPYNNQQELAWLEVSVDSRRGTGSASVPQCRLDSPSRWCYRRAPSPCPHHRMCMCSVLCAFCVVLWSVLPSLVCPAGFYLRSLAPTSVRPRVAVSLLHVSFLLFTYYQVYTKRWRTFFSCSVGCIF